MKAKIINAMALIVPFLLAYDFLVIANHLEYANQDKEPGKGMYIHKHRYADGCGWECFADTRNCLENHDGLPRGLRNAISPAYFGFIYALRSTGNYQGANLLYLAFLWPLILSFLAVKTIKLARNNRDFSSFWVLGTVILTAGVLFTCPYVFTGVSHFHYLTDFLITLTHWTGLSYYDINALVFVIIWPIMSIIIPALWFIMRRRESCRSIAVE